LADPTTIAKMCVLQWQESEFTLYVPHVGPLEQVTLATDGSAWLCDLIVVEDKHLQETLYFICSR